MASHRERLLRDYAPRLAQRADQISGPNAPGGTVSDPQTLGGILDIQVIGDDPTETEDTGVMVAFYVPQDAAEQLALDDIEDPDVDIEDPDELHLTLAYLGTAGIDITPDSLDLLATTVAAWAAQTQPITGTASGIGVFNNEDTAVTYASYDSPQLPTARQNLVQMLTTAGLKPVANHGFTPHITLAYGDARGATVPNVPITFDTVTIAYAGEQMALPLGNADTPPAPTPDEAKSVPLGQDVPPQDDPDGDGPDPEGETDNDSKVVKNVPARPQFIASSTRTINDWHPIIHNGPSNTTNGFMSWKPIVTTHGARTIITGPATTERAAMWGNIPNPNPHMLWMQGRFVGAERANRNGAYWSTADLEVGQPTVAHGPLNWLHEEHHVIGTIADAKFVPSEQLTVAGTNEQAAATTDPHIAALSAIWQWIYPQEASVVQMASDSGVLAYSMECIAQAIQCVGDAGCGQAFPFMQVALGDGGCQHLQQRSSVRRLVNPTFLGGAVIVPPTRPGWADADACVMKEAAAMAEHAYEQAGHPDIPATTWEQLMARVVTYTVNGR